MPAEVSSTIFQRSSHSSIIPIHDGFGLWWKSILYRPAQLGNGQWSRNCQQRRWNLQIRQETAAGHTECQTLGERVSTRMRDVPRLKVVLRVTNFLSGAFPYHHIFRIYREFHGCSPMVIVCRVVEDWQVSRKCQARVLPGSKILELGLINASA